MMAIQKSLRIKLPVKESAAIVRMFEGPFLGYSLVCGAGTHVGS